MDNHQNNNENKEKNIAYYSALVNAWVESNMERDKSILSLSVGAIGLLVGLLSTVGIKNKWELIFYISALIAFIFSIIVILLVFRRNSKYIEDVITNKNKGQDKILEFLDKLVIFLFIIALVFSSTIGIITALNNYSYGDTKMSNKEKGQFSLNKISMIKPDQTRSLNGIANLKPSQDSNTNANANTASQGTGQQGSGSNQSGNK